MIQVLSKHDIRPRQCLDEILQCVQFHNHLFSSLACLPDKGERPQWATITCTFYIFSEKYFRIQSIRSITHQVPSNILTNYEQQHEDIQTKNMFFICFWKNTYYIYLWTMSLDENSNSKTTFEHKQFSLKKQMVDKWLQNKQKYPKHYLIASSIWKFLIKQHTKVEYFAMKAKIRTVWTDIKAHTPYLLLRFVIIKTEG